MGVNSLPKTVTRQRRDCDFNPGRTAPKSSTLTTRLPSHPTYGVTHIQPVVKLLGAMPEGPKLEPKGPRAKVGFPTADPGFSSTQDTLFGFCRIYIVFDVM